MKKYFFTLMLLALIGQVTAQTTNEKSLTCYDEYYQAFRNRGALPVTDGEHNVVFSLRTDTGCYCGEALARVADGKLEPWLMVKREDGTYEPAKRRLHPKMKKGEEESPNLYNVFDGMSHTFITTDYEIVNLFFIDLLKRKVVAYAKAPSPNDIEGVQIDLPNEQKQIIQQLYEGLQFEYAKATIKPASFPHLNLLAQMMKDNKDYKLQVNGYTDNVGNAEGNLKLSQERADAVKTYLVEKGLGDDRIAAKGFGIESPIADNKTAEGRAMNRRVEFIVTK